MSKDDYFETEGTVVTALPNAKFVVNIDQPIGKEMTCNISGKVRRHHIRILPGDRVTVAIALADPTQGRITFRMRPERKEQL